VAITSAPGNLRVTDTTANSIALAWNASTDDVGVTGYDVFRENGATHVPVRPIERGQGYGQRRERRQVVLGVVEQVVAG
jgi:hypothetical protein